MKTTYRASEFSYTLITNKSYDDTLDSSVMKVSMKLKVLES